MYILLIWNTILLNLVFLTWYQSHCSNLSLSSLVSLVVTPFSSLPLNNSHCSHSLLNLRRLSAVVLGFRAYSRRRWGVPHHTNHCIYRLRCESYSDMYFVGTTVIVSPQPTQSWKSHSHRSLHAPLRAAQRSCASVTHFTQLIGSILAVVITAPLALADIIVHSPADITRHVSWHHRWPDRWLRWPDRWPALTRVD